MNRPPRVIILYHFFHPDDVVSAQQFAGLAAGLAERGFQVEVQTSNRFCHHPGAIALRRESWQGVEIRRTWRPGLAQKRFVGRIVNAAWMIADWCRLAFRRGPATPDIVLMGTDPIFSVVVAGVLKTLRPRLRTVHWAFDLYPEAAVADDLFAPKAGLVRLMQAVMGWAYRRCDLIADIGPCMRERLRAYRPRCPQHTLVPWSLVEPESCPAPDPAVRARLFGPDARLAVLYSGSFGRAHAHEDFLALARAVRRSGVMFCFAGRGNRFDELRAAVTADDANIRFADFVPEKELQSHLAAADVHLASLRGGWTGVVVPSKFFGSLAMGRPVLFAGDPAAGIAQWIHQHHVGWVVSNGDVGTAATALRELSSDLPRLRDLQRHCWSIYQREFARRKTLDAWAALLARLT